MGEIDGSGSGSGYGSGDGSGYGSGYDTGGMMQLEKLRELCSRLPKEDCWVEFVLEFEDEEVKTICDAFPLLIEIADKAYWYKKMIESGKCSDDHAVAICQDLEAALSVLKEAP